MTRTDLLLGLIFAALVSLIVLHLKPRPAPAAPAQRWEFSDVPLRSISEPGRLGWQVAAVYVATDGERRAVLQRPLER